MKQKELVALKDFYTMGDLQKLADHAVHFGNCDLEPWSPRLIRCRCGLFQLLRRLEVAGLIKRDT